MQESVSVEYKLRTSDKIVIAILFPLILIILIGGIVTAPLLGNDPSKAWIFQSFFIFICAYIVFGFIKILNMKIVLGPEYIYIPANSILFRSDKFETSEYTHFAYVALPQRQPSVVLVGHLKAIVLLPAWGNWVKAESILDWTKQKFLPLMTSEGPHSQEDFENQLKVFYKM